MGFSFRIFTRRKDELDEEIQAHLRMDIEARRDRGESAEQARASAMREFGNVALIKDVTQERWGWVWLERFGQDLRYALRQLKRSPIFALSVIATLSIGLGATAAMFTVVDHVLLQPLPYRDSAHLVEIRELGKKGVAGCCTPFLDIQQWHERSHSLKEIAFYGANKHTSFLEGNTGSLRVNSPQISANLFSTLGVRPAIGRSFEGQNDGAALAGEAHTLILSDIVWRAAYGGDTHILGKTVKLNGESYVVVGVMPRGFTFPFGSTDLLVWTPIVIGKNDTIRIRNATPNYWTIARLEPNISIDSAESELKVVQLDVVKAYTDPYDRERISSIKLQRYDDSLIGSDTKRSLLALFGASGVLWLIACVNGAGLMLARSTSRQREIAVRGALGASRWRIVQQLAVEGLLLSGLSSVVGLVLSTLMLTLFKHALITQFHVHEKMAINTSVIGLLIGLTVISALICSVWPAMVAARAAIEPALRQGGTQNSSGLAQYRSRSLLVVMQIAMSLVLLVGCGLLLRTIHALRHVPLGFRTDHIIVANMTIPAYKFAGVDMTTELYQPLVDRVNHMSGVQSASLMTEVPLGKTFDMEFTFEPEGNAAAEVRRRDMTAQFRAVGPEMQRVFGFRMLKGRFFNQEDTPGSRPMVIVNRAFVKSYFGGDEAPEKILGESLFGYGKSKRAVVVGVLDDERQVSIAQQSLPEIEVCIPQITPDTGFYKSAEGLAMDLAVRTERNPSAIIPELRELMRSASPELADSTFTTMDQVVEDSYGNQQLAAKLLIAFGGSALLLCLTGIYGLLAYLVTHRTKELGVRIALGAKRGDVMWLVLRQASWMLLVGVSLGLILSCTSSVLLKIFLYEIAPRDPWTMGAVSLLLLTGGLVASYLPAKRAAEVDPIQALRSE